VGIIIYRTFLVVGKKTTKAKVWIATCCFVLEKKQDKKAAENGSKQDFSDSNQPAPRHNQLIKSLLLKQAVLRPNQSACLSLSLSQQPRSSLSVFY
jgi:hypothetical protein